MVETFQFVEGKGDASGVPTAAATGAGGPSASAPTEEDNVPF
jgi:hypothetical protein